MRRADRLFQIVQWLRRRRTVTTAEALAERLGVSRRTVYRDIADLQRAGTPIDGEAGVGYRMRAGYDLPPLMFTRDELEALVLGARVVEQCGDERLARASAGILAKVATVVPPDLARVFDETRLYAPALATDARASRVLGVMRDAIGARRKVWIRYREANGRASERVVRPLGAFFWGRVWTIAAWCEWRQDFRNFRPDRVDEIRALDERFADEPGRTLADLLAPYGPAALKLLDR